MNKVSVSLYIFPFLFKTSIKAHVISIKLYAIKILALFKTRRQLYGLSYDELIDLSIADCQLLKKGPRAYSIATSRGSPAELGVFRALSESPEK